MPQQVPSSNRSLTPFQLAQGGETHEETTHASTGHAGGEAEHHSVGDVPNATLLFWNSLLIATVLVVFALIVTRRRLADVPKGLQNLAEYIAESLNHFTVGIIGPGGERYTPVVGTVFLYIMMMNLIGLVPGFHSPSANLSITLALGVVIFVYVQFLGIRSNGVVGHIKHFMGPMPAMAPLIMVVELISEFIKPFTLAVRLFGNIFGEDVILLVLAGLGAASVATMWIPIQFPVMLLALLTGLVQAMVFSILTCIYISLVTHHEHEEHGEEGSHGAAHAHASGH